MTETDRTKFTFDLRTIPSNATITGVSLSYTIYNAGDGSYDFYVTAVPNYGDPSSLWQGIGSSTPVFSLITYGSGSLSSSSLTSLVNSSKGSYMYLGAYSDGESSSDSYANLSLTLSVTYTVNIIADNNFTASDGTHGSIKVDGYTYTAPYSFLRYTGTSVTFEAISPQTDNQGYQRIWNTTSCNKSYWDRSGTFKSNDQTYTFSVASDDNGKKYQANFHQNRVTTSGTMASNENWISSVTLTGNVTVPSGVTLTITSCATVNLLNGSNHYSIVSTGGTINKEAGATISNLRATLTHNGSELKGLCGTIQAAANAIPDYHTFNSYQILMPNGSFSETVNISNKYNVLVHGSGSTTIGGTVSVSNCEACTFHSFAANALSLSGCVIPDISVELDIGSTNPSLYAYNCTNLSFHDANVSDRYAYVNGIGLQFYQSSTSWMTGSSTLVYHNVRAILANSSSVAVNNVYFCNNTYDLTTTFGGTIYARLCYYPGGVPSTQGSGITIDGANIADCTGIPKRSATLSKSMVENTDTVAMFFPPEN